MELLKNPLISIVTVVLDNKECLERTIQSVIGQTYKNIEYIIVDGGSTDGTLGIIKKYENSICTWISEADSGIYDAMNKGIALARGEFINFMNAGDLFYENNILEKIFTKYPRDAEIFYGDCEVRYDRYLKRVKKAGVMEGLWKGMIFSHQSMFTRSSLLKKYKFDTNLATAADFNFTFDMYLNGHKFYYTDLIISSILAGGISDKHYLQGATGWWRVVRKHKNSLKVNAFYSLLILNLLFISIIKNIFPKTIIDSVLRLKLVLTKKSIDYKT